MNDKIGKKKSEPYRIDIEEASITVRRLTFLFSPFSFDITSFKSIDKYYYYSIITEILIHLRDLLFKLNAIGNRIDFKDYITKDSEKGIEDISDLIKHFRDAACHNESPNRRNFKGYIFAGNIFAAYDFDDEITLLMGDSKLYVKRHLVRLYRSVLQRFASYDEFLDNKDFREALGSAQMQGAF